MKYIDEYRDGALAKGLAAAIAAEVNPARHYRFMEFCGGHTHAIARYGLEDLLPPSIRMIHGPGCPVCVLPVGRIDNAIALARLPGVILCTYGDLMRVPGSGKASLFHAKSEGCDVRMVYSTLDALQLAREHPDRQVIFFAIGFETTTPPTALAIRQAQVEGLANFSVFCNHVLTPSAIQNILDSPEVRVLGKVKIDGFLGPSHVSTIIGSRPYEFFAEEYQRPVVITGFEPLDVLQAILMLVRQVNEGRFEVENEYARAVSPAGNLKAQALVAEVFELRPVFEWRGLGSVPYSGLRIKEAYAAFDAERRFDIPHVPAQEPKGCICPAVIRGLKRPMECPLFGTVCTPENPVGSCMVSSEGACAAQWRYGRHRIPPKETLPEDTHSHALNPFPWAEPSSRRILLLTHAFNSLTQRLLVELEAKGHAVTIEFDIHDDVAMESVRLANPDLIIAPFLKRAIPEAIWREYRCLVVHPGPPGDRGPAALDWAILNGAKEWGVTVLQAEAEMDAGPVWASRTFPMREAAKGSLYRREVTEAAVSAVLEALETSAGPTPAKEGHWKPALRQADRAIDWATDDTAAVLRKIRSADGFPGLLDEIFGEGMYLFDAHPAESLTGNPGCVIARCGEAIARATVDGAVWIGHLQRKEGPSLKLPAAMVLGERLSDVPERAGYDEIVYEECEGVGTLHFPFYNGAMSTGQCERLRAAYRNAAGRDTKVIVLMGGPDFWSNGIHLNVIEAAPSPADESWRNINAMDDLCREILTTASHLTIAAMQGNAGAGGVFLALAADRVFARNGVVLNPHYKGMGNLYGSEYWTYLLPRRTGPERAAEVMQARRPVGAIEAQRMGLIDEHFGASQEEFARQVHERARAWVASPDLPAILEEKNRQRMADEAEKPLEAYRREELERMKLNFYGFDPSYHVARYNFVRKIPKSRTPLYLALHRRA